MRQIITKNNITEAQHRRLQSNL